MTPEERITQLEQRLALAEARIAALESRPQQPPTNPWLPKNPWDPPYTITCKMADGSVQEMKLDGPIVAQGVRYDTK
jgi:hypothetical protein